MKGRGRINVIPTVSGGGRLLPVLMKGERGRALISVCRGHKGEKRRFFLFSK